MNLATQRPYTSKASKANQQPQVKGDDSTNTFEWWAAQAQTILDGNFPNKEVQACFIAHNQKVIFPHGVEVEVVVVVNYQGRRILSADHLAAAMDDLALWLRDSSPKWLHNAIKRWGC
jgi:hypothetical protein